MMNCFFGKYFYLVLERLHSRISTGPNETFLCHLTCWFSLIWNNYFKTGLNYINCFMLFRFEWNWSNYVGDIMLVTWCWWQSDFLFQLESWKVNPKFIFELVISLLIAFAKFTFFFAIFKWYMWCYQKNLFYQEHLYVIGICGKIFLDNFSLFGNFFAN